MKRNIGRLAVATALALIARSGDAQESPTIAIIHAHAFPVAGPPVEDATIVIANGRIIAVAAHGPAPAGAEQIDAKGRIVTPGLFGSATQLGLTEVSENADTDDRAVASGPLGPAFDVQYALNGNSTLIPTARADA